MHGVRFLLILLCCVLWVTARESEEERLLREEIQLIQQKSASLDREIASLEQDTDKDYNQREVSKKEFHESRSLLENDVASLKNEQLRFEKENRSLRRQLSRTRRSIEVLQGNEKELVQTVIHECSLLVALLNPLPDYYNYRYETSLRFLRSELAGGSVGASEGSERLFRIYRKIIDDSEQYDSWQGASPVPNEPGVFTHIRLGLFYHAAVSERKAYLYGNGVWQKSDQEVDQELLNRAASTAQGTRTPEISHLPFVIYREAPNE